MAEIITIKNNNLDFCRRFFTFQPVLNRNYFNNAQVVSKNSVKRPKTDKRQKFSTKTKTDVENSRAKR